MKQFFLIFILIFLAAFWPLNAMAIAIGTNITIYDKNGTGAGWHGSDEDQEVEPGMATGQEWDLEGFFLEGTTLTMVGGFDFEFGNSDYTSGDIFIDIIGIGKNAVYGDIHGPQNGNGNYTVSNSFSYDYVLDLDFSTYTYDVYRIYDSSLVKTAFYHQNQGSSPWRYVQGGDLIKHSSFKYVTKLPDENDKFEGGDHNAVVVSLDFLQIAPQGTDFISHFTMGCGNDNLMGQGKLLPNPEPATLFLMGCGLIGLAGLGRKNFQRAKIE
ncbi:MAG: PEP-CTERM sorting domain-containing protein [Pseudomonadota bacterium]